MSLTARCSKMMLVRTKKATYLEHEANNSFRNMCQLGVNVGHDSNLHTRTHTESAHARKCTNCFLTYMATRHTTAYMHL